MINKVLETTTCQVVNPQSSNEVESSPDHQLQPISDLIGIMRTVHINDPESILNRTTISDGKGGRILL